jgi:hypothetical protein
VSALTQADVQLAMIQAKTARAKHHISQVENIASEKISPGFLSSFKDSKGKSSGQGRVRVIPIELIMSAGDAIHNLRSALDHLAWQLSHWENWKPTERCAFPVGNSLADYNHKKAKAVEGMSSEAKNAIDLLKPYKNGNDLLYAIHRLDIVDKHHQIFVFGYRDVISGLPFPGTLSALTDQPAHFLGIFAGDFVGYDKNLEQSPAAEVQGSRMPLIPALNEMLIYTENVIQEFKPLLVQLIERSQILHKPSKSSGRSIP